MEPEEAAESFSVEPVEEPEVAVENSSVEPAAEAGSSSVEGLAVQVLEAERSILAVG